MFSRKLLSGSIFQNSFPLWQIESPILSLRCTAQRSATSSAKFNLRHPRSPGPAKAKILHALRPLFVPDMRRPAEKCHMAQPKHLEKTREPYPIETILAREARKILDASQIVILCHKNPCSLEELKSYRNAVWKLNLRIWPQFNNQVLRFALEGGRYATMTRFLETSCMLVTSSELNLKNTVRGLKRLEGVVPLMAFLNGRFLLSIPQLEELSLKYKNGTVDAHAELLSILTNSGQSVVHSLQHQTTTLSACLDFLAKKQSAEATPPLGEAPPSVVEAVTTSVA